MLALTEIEKLYPESLRGFKRFILREYLQHKLLQIIFDSAWGSRFVFLGGTCLRIVHGNNRFSEDLDFDNTGIGEAEFSEMSAHIQRMLELEGYQVEMKPVYKGAYHCYIRFPELLYMAGLSGHPEEKILIQLDTEPQHFAYTPDSYFLNRFDIFTNLRVTPPNLLLAQKFYAILNRVRNKGRDFYDAIFLLGRGALPNYDYLNQKIGINSANQLREAVIEHCNKLDMNEMAKDVQPFLFQPTAAGRVANFVAYIRQAPF